MEGYSEKLFGVVEPDPVGHVLRTGYVRFQRPDGVAGLIRVNGRRLDVLAIDVAFKGRGYFKKFVEEIKREFDTIGMWHILNYDVVPMLLNWDFKKIEEVESIEGHVEFLDGYIWQLPR